MRTIIVLEHISLDGVIQAPGGPDKDRSDGFANGGWAAPYDDDILGAALQKQMNMPFDLLLGRKTFDIWAAFWPQHADVWPGAGTPTFPHYASLLRPASAILTARAEITSWQVPPLKRWTGRLDGKVQIWRDAGKSQKLRS